MPLSRLFLTAFFLFTSGIAFAQVPATISWTPASIPGAAPIPTLGGTALAILGLLLFGVALQNLRSRRATLKIMLPFAAGALLTFQYSPYLIDAAEAVAGYIELDTSPKDLASGSNVVQNVQAGPVKVTALTDGTCTIDQGQASAPACQVGTTLEPGGTCGVFVDCGPGGDGLTPGSTDIVSADGIDGTGTLDFRCLEWSGDACIRPQSRMPASTCADYVDADVWHDMTYFNSPEQRICPSFCGAVTTSGGVTNCAAAGTTATATANGHVSTGYAANETGCRGPNDSRWRNDYVGQNGDYNIRHSNYGTGTPRLSITCDWD